MERFPVCAARLDRIEPVTHDTQVYTYTLEREMPFVAGQFFNLAVPDALPRPERSYSVWSDPADASQLQFCIKLFPGGKASEMLRKALLGDVHSIRGPYGVFTLRPDPDPIVFVVTATGLAPARSMLLQARRERDPRRFRLYFGVRAEADLFSLDELAELRRDLPDFDFLPCLSRPSPEWTGFRGRVTDAVARDFPSPADRFYLCGNGSMIEDVRTLLKDRGLDRKRIHFEKYY